MDFRRGVWGREVYVERGVAVGLQFVGSVLDDLGLNGFLSCVDPFK